MRSGARRRKQDGAVLVGRGDSDVDFRALNGQDNAAGTAVENLVVASNRTDLFDGGWRVNRARDENQVRDERLESAGIPRGADRVDGWCRASDQRCEWIEDVAGAAEWHHAGVVGDCGGGVAEARLEALAERLGHAAGLEGVNEFTERQDVQLPHEHRGFFGLEDAKVEKALEQSRQHCARVRCRRVRACNSQLAQSPMNGRGDFGVVVKAIALRALHQRADR
jgi:hypothetical protein